MKKESPRGRRVARTRRAAVEEGMSLGGGVALIRCLSVLEGLKLRDEDEQIESISSSAHRRADSAYWLPTPV